MNTRKRHGSRNTEEGVYLGLSQTQDFSPLSAPPAATAAAPINPPQPQWDAMSCQDRTHEFRSACKSLQSRENGLHVNKPAQSGAIRQRSEFTLMAKRIGKDLSNTFAKLEKLTICEYLGIYALQRLFRNS
ncbi:hypothetical protein E2320_013892 [Naja naja]|nr:hypothetical protein E2320_013892 [Naja naja]